MIIQPFGKRLYIKPEKQQTLIKSDEKLIERGEIIAVGGLCNLQKGDKILFTSWGTDSVEVDGEKIYFVLESDEFILATIKM